MQAFFLKSWDHYLYIYIYIYIYFKSIPKGDAEHHAESSGAQNCYFFQTIEFILVFDTWHLLLAIPETREFKRSCFLVSRLLRMLLLSWFSPFSAQRVVWAWGVRFLCPPLCVSLPAMVIPPTPRPVRLYPGHPKPLSCGTSFCPF